MNQEDSKELRWIREELEEHNKLIKEQNAVLKLICKNLKYIYEGMP